MIMQQVPDPLRVGDSVVEGHSTMEKSPFLVGNF